MVQPSTWIPKASHRPHPTCRLTIHDRSSFNIPPSIADDTILLSCQVRDTGSPMTTAVLCPISYPVLFSFSNTSWIYSFPSILFCYHIVHGLAPKTSTLAFSGIKIRFSTTSFLMSLHTQEPRGLNTTLPYQIWTPLLLCQRAIIWCLLYLSNLISTAFENICVLIIFCSYLY